MSHSAFHCEEQITTVCFYRQASFYNSMVKSIISARQPPGRKSGYIFVSASIIAGT
jgi:hypothetical protein